MRGGAGKLMNFQEKEEEEEERMRDGAGKPMEEVIGEEKEL